MHACKDNCLDFIAQHSPCRATTVVSHHTKLKDMKLTPSWVEEQPRLPAHPEKDSASRKAEPGLARNLDFPAVVLDGRL